MALSLDKKHKPLCEENGCPSEKIPDRDRLHNLSLSSDVLLGVGSAFAATGIITVI